MSAIEIAAPVQAGATLGYLKLALAHGVIPAPVRDWDGPAFASLIPPGMRTMSAGELVAVAVNPFPESKTRRGLWQAFECWRADLEAREVVSEIWLAGSFLSTKPEPRDLDVVLILHADRVEAMADDAISGFDGALAEAIAGGISPSLAFDQDFAMRTYLQGLFAFFDDGITPRGIAVLQGQHHAL